MGLSVGFSQDILLKGSDIEQIGTSSNFVKDPLGDINCMKIGFALFHQHGKHAETLTSQHIMNALEAEQGDNISESRSEHWCWNNKNQKHIK